MYRYLFVIVGRGRRGCAPRSPPRGYAPRTRSGAARSGGWPARCSCAPTRRGERVHLAMLARGYAGTMPRAAPLRSRRADVAFVALVLARARAAARRLGRHELRDARPRPALPPTRTGSEALRGVDLHVARRRAGRAARPQRRRQDDAHAPPQRAAARDGRARGGRASRRARAAARPARARRPGLPGPRRPAVHADRPRGRRLRPAQRSGWAATRSLRACARRWPPYAWTTPPSARRTSSRWASAGGWPSPPCWPCLPDLLVLDEPSANLDPRARRELLEVLEPHRPHAAAGHARPAAGRRAVRARRDPGARASRRRRAGRRGARRRRDCWPSTTSSCPAGSTSRAWRGARGLGRSRCRDACLLACGGANSGGEGEGDHRRPLYPAGAPCARYSCMRCLGSRSRPQAPFPRCPGRAASASESGCPGGGGAATLTAPPSTARTPPACTPRTAGSQRVRRSARRRRTRARDPAAAGDRAQGGRAVEPPVEAAALAAAQGPRRRALVGLPVGADQRPRSFHADTTPATPQP